jgi:hypothetical protein
MTVSHPGSALGEAVGKLIEEEIKKAVCCIAERKYGLYTYSGKLKNGDGNQYQIDRIINDKNGKPLMTVEVKYLRYKKHNRDKASWTCTAHYNLRKTHPSIRKSIAILAGNWSRPSKALLKSFGVEVHEIPFEKMVSVLKAHNIIFDWDEKDRETAKKSWNRYQGLTEGTKKRIGAEITKEITPAIKKSMEHTITADPNVPKEIAEVELLIKTNYGEFYVQRCKTAQEGLKYLIDLQADKKDLRDILKSI